MDNNKFKNILRSKKLLKGAKKIIKAKNHIYNEDANNYNDWS